MKLIEQIYLQLCQELDDIERALAASEEWTSLALVERKFALERQISEVADKLPLTLTYKETPYEY